MNGEQPQGVRPTDHLISVEKALLIDLCLGVPLGGIWDHGNALEAGAGDAADTGPETLLLGPEQLRSIARRYRAGDLATTRGVRALCSQAESLLDLEPFSVTRKTATPPSGDMRDYYSIGRYWWPDPEQSDGLPYVKRDGETNPESRSDAYDAARLNRFSEASTLLSLAGYLAMDEQASTKAAELVRTWFVEPATRMNPHFRFAQAIPGRDVVPVRGIVEGRRLVYVIDAVQLLAYVGALAADELAVVKSWFAELLEWMTDDERARSASDADNNVAFWYELQLVAFARFVGDDELAGERVGEVVPRWMAEQIADDASLPAELMRARPTDYVAFSLLAMAQLDQAGRATGIDLWSEKLAGGRTMSAAVDWLRRITSEPELEHRLRQLSTGREREHKRPGASEADDPLLEDRLVDLAIAIRGVEVCLDLPARKEANRKALEQQQRASEQQRRAEALKITTRNMQRRIVEHEGTIVRLERETSTLAKQLAERDKEIEALKPDAPRRGSVAPRELGERRTQQPPISQLKAEYQARGLDQEEDSFVLYRIIGNSLQPRHDPHQSQKNARFILEHEPPFERCEKRWIVNRIYDPEEEAEIIRLLEEHDQAYLRIPFDWDEYRQVPWDFDGFPEPLFFLSGAAHKLKERAWHRAEAHARRHKNNYAMHNNGARNAALRDGRRRAKWVLPWDGNCFLTEAAWYEILAAVEAQPHLKYFIVPMARVVDNEQLLDPACELDAQEEPQVVFRRDAGEKFNEDCPYGRRPKVELLWRLGVPGKWDGWHLDDIWDLPRPELAEEAAQHTNAGWVARLFSGQADLEDQDGEKKRGIARNEAIMVTLDHLDVEALRRSLDAQALMAYHEDAIEALVTEASSDPATRSLLDRLRAEADAALGRGPYSVVDKETLPPSGDRQDYWHPAPYWWPNPETEDGLPYVRRDGERVPGTRMYEPDSDKYDRTRLQRMFDDTTIAALAWMATGLEHYAEHGANLVRQWFISPDTRMNPHLRYAQVRIGHGGNQGDHSGLIEMKDLYYFLDAVRLLRRSGALSPEDTNEFANWLGGYRDWLVDSRQGSKEKRAENNHGTCYDLQLASIAAYLDDVPLLASTFRDSHERLVDHFDANGLQSHEIARTQTAHYCCFNYQSWVNLATLAERCGIDLWNLIGHDGRGLRRGFESLLPHIRGEEWPWPQTDEFDRDRYLPIYHAGRARFPYLIELDAVPVPPAHFVKPIFFPHDGIKPFWMLGERPDSGIAARSNGVSQPQAAMIRAAGAA